MVRHHEVPVFCVLTNKRRKNMAKTTNTKYEQRKVYIGLLGSYVAWGGFRLMTYLLFSLTGTRAAPKPYRDPITGMTITPDSSVYDTMNAMSGEFTGLYALLWNVGWCVGAIGMIVWAYMNYDQSGHPRFLVRTAFLGLVMMVVASFFVRTPIEMALLAFWLIWSFARCISGFRLAITDKSVTNPGTWGFIAR